MYRQLDVYLTEGTVFKLKNKEGLMLDWGQAKLYGGGFIQFKGVAAGFCFMENYAMI